MATTVTVSGISHETSEKEVKDFFSFCGKITSLNITPSSAAPDSSKQATVTFEKETAAKTALLLDNTQLGKSQVHVLTAHNVEEVGAAAGTHGAVHEGEHHISQEDKPRSRIVAEYLAQGYTFSDTVLQRAIDLDSKHGISNRFTSALTNFDDRYKATEKAQNVDARYGVTDKAMGAWGGFSSYFEKALGTPTGQKVRQFYVETDKQVRDIHTEARRLADLKSGKPEPVPGTDKTHCNCGGSDGVCQCVPGKCSCSSCAKNTDEPSEKSHMNPPEAVTGTEKTVCSCGGAEGVCGCKPGECACASCAKSTPAATTEAKEAAQASGQHLPTGSV